MSKYLFVGDLHFGIKDDEDFLMYQFDTWDWILKTAKEHDADIIQFGDVFDKRREINYKILAKIREQFKKLDEQEIQFFYIAGNHDVYYKNTNVLNSMNLLFSESKKIHMTIDLPTELGNMLLVPWMTDSNYDDISEIMKKTKAKYCLGHFEISGFQMTKGFECEKGLSPSTFKKFKKVFSGHFHIGSEIGNIRYIGTPFELNWNDWNDPKYIFIFDADSGNLKPIQNKMTMFHRISVDEKTDFKTLIKNKEWDKKIVKVVFNVEPTKDAEKFLAHIEPYCLGLDIINNFQILTDNSEIEVKSLDVYDIFAEYITIKDFPESIDKKRIQTLFKDIYTEASAEMSEI